MSKSEVKGVLQEFNNVLDVETDELYRIAVRDKLRIKVLEKEMELQVQITKDVLYKVKFLKHQISEANAKFYIGKPKIEVPTNY